MNRIIVFLREVRTEMTKVSWPSRTQLMRYTGVVLGICLFIAIYLGGLDALYASALSRLIVR